MLRMNHRLQKGISVAAFAALLLVSLACVPPPQPHPRPYPPKPVGGVSVSPLSVPDREFPAQHGAIRALAFDRSGRWMATARADGKVALWDFATGRLAWQADERTGEIRGLAFRSDGSALVTVGASGIAGFLDVQSGKLLKTVDVHRGEINVVAFSADGRLLATTGKDHSVKLWDVATGGSLQTPRGHTDAVNALAFSPDGTVLASGSADKSIRLWNVKTGELLRAIAGLEDPVTALAFWPDGTRVVSGTAHAAPFSHRGRYQTWYAASGGPFVESAPVYAVSALAVSGDGKMIAVAYRGDGNWWNTDILRVDEGRVLHRYVAHRNRIVAIAFTPDGRSLISAGTDGAIRVWP